MSLLILGAGYVGERLRAAHASVTATRRQADDTSIRFDLAAQETWEGLPAADAVVWTFPAAPVELARRFRDHALRHVKNLIVLGSTSAYLTREPDEWVSEETPLDLAQPRVAGEESLRQSGATVLQLAGIWGPGRDPIRWLLDGRVRNGLKHVNLAHVDDILAAISAVIAAPRPGERLNVCDGEPRRWREHVAALAAEGRLPPAFELPETPPGLDSKRVRNDRLRAMLPAHRFTRLSGF
jgi:nucleoside-diphosphate-sugar epimerase